MSVQETMLLEMFIDALERHLGRPITRHEEIRIKRIGAEVHGLCHPGRPERYDISSGGDCDREVEAMCTVEDIAEMTGADILI